MSTKQTLFSVLAICVLFLTSCTIDGNDSVDPKPEVNNNKGYSPNETVLRAFDISFPNAKNTVWSTNSTYNVADFTENGVSKNAWFDNDGKWYLSKLSVSTSQLPKSVSGSFAKGSYANWNLKSSSVLERKDMGEIYVIEASGTTEDVKIYYSKYGDLIKAVGNGASYTDKPVNVPAEVNTLIANLFQQVQIIDMWNDALGTKVCVLDNNEYKVVALDGSYDWICTIINLTREVVPERVMNSFMNSEYGVYAIDDIKQMESKEENTYLFYFNTEDKHKVATLKESGSFKSILSY